MNRRPIPDRMEGLRPVRAPAELQQRAMAAARAALRGSPRRTDRWTRIRDNRGARWVWAAAVLLFFAGHLVLSIPPRPAAGVSRTDRQWPAGVGPEVEPLIRLSRIKALPALDDGSAPSTRRDARQEDPS